MRVLRVIVAVFAVFVLVVMTVPAWLVPFRRCRGAWLSGMRRVWARPLLRLLRVRIHVEPAQANFSGPALYVANHTGYLDIVVVMSLVPGVFISREGIIWWPVIGQLAALAGTLFVNRKDRLSIGRLVEKVRRRLRVGASVVFFPEATTTNGEMLLPFRTSLFAAADAGDGEIFPIRPLVLCYRSVGGKPLDTANRDRVFWYDNMTLLGHIWRLLTVRGIDVVVKVLPERTLSADRREFGRTLREEMLREIEPPRRQKSSPRSHEAHEGNN